MSYEIIFVDIRGIFSDFRPHHVGPAFVWRMWLWIVISPLKGVDRRDELAQITYMAVVAAFGVLFLLVFPIGRPKVYSPPAQIILFLVLLVVPSIRWVIRRKVTDLDRRMISAGVQLKK
jgi:uncharacterized membrane protein YfhO